MRRRKDDNPARVPWPPRVQLLRPTALLEALGLPPDPTDPELVIDTAKDLAAQVAGMTPEQPSSVAVAAKRHGTEVIDTATAEALRRDAAEGRKIATAAARAKVEAAVDKGKITPARRKALGRADRGRPRHGRGTGRRPQRDRGAPCWRSGIPPTTATERCLSLRHNDSRLANRGPRRPLRAGLVRSWADAGSARGATLGAVQLLSAFAYR